MALTQEEMKRLKEAFSACTRPLILFDNDPDGFASFLLIYSHVREGRGVPVKNAPEMNPDFARSVNDYSPDLVVILDIPHLSQEFLDRISAPIVWVDHHQPIERKKVEYFNPRIHDDADNRPTSYWVYKSIGGPLWIAMCGIIGDWHMPEDEIRKEFISKYPDLLPADITRPEVALHDTPIGKLSKVLSFNIKGKAVDAIKSVKTFTRIKSPYEILKQETSGGRFVYRKFRQLEEEYQSLWKQVKVDPEDKVLVFVYQSSGVSFTKELSNELVYRHPDKLIIIAWEYNGEYKCSLRSTKHNLPRMLEKALVDVSGYGGGHEHASGACIKKADFERFVENMRKQL